MAKRTDANAELLQSSGNSSSFRNNLVPQLPNLHMHPICGSRGTDPAGTTLQLGKEKILGDNQGLAPSDFVNALLGLGFWGRLSDTVCWHSQGHLSINAAPPTSARP